MKRLASSILLIVLLFAVSCKNTTETESEPAGTLEQAEPKVKGEAVEYATDSTNLKGYIAYDENLSGKRPGILIIHEWWGHNDYVRERADMLAKLGYTAIAVDMYGDGKQAEHPDAAADSGSMCNSGQAEVPLAAHSLLGNFPHR